jgi:hypothetical protein
MPRNFVFMLLRLSSEILQKVNFVHLDIVEMLRLLAIGSKYYMLNAFKEHHIGLSR